MDPASVCDMIVQFFRSFATPGDVRRALQDLYVYPHYAALLPLDAPVPACVEQLPLTRYEVSGGARATDEAAERVRVRLAMALEPLGFTMTAGPDVIAVRERGSMFDAIRVMLDEYSTFATLLCFPWPAAVWQADANWAGTYYPMLSFPVMKDDNMLVLTTEAFCAVPPRNCKR